jgi:glutamate synthase (NADPH/NADH) large chain
MSGGIAYVYDPQGEFPSRVNFDMVSFAEMDDEDVEFLHDVVRQHQHETGSAVAAGLLGDWDTELRNFCKVMPNDYRRVLEATRRAEAEGRDVIEAVMEASRG